MKIISKLTIILCFVLLSETFCVSKANMKRSKLFASNSNTFETEMNTNSSTESSSETDTSEFDDLDGFSVEPSKEAPKPQSKKAAPVNNTNTEQAPKTEEHKKLFKLKKKRQDQMQMEMQSQSSSQSFSSSSTSSQSSSSSSSQSYSSNSSLSFSMNAIKLQQATKWKTLFKTMDRSQSCSKSEKSKITRKKSEKDRNMFLHNGLPFSKPSWNEKHFGGNEVGYYFDYLDPCWQKPISQIFKNLYEEAKKMPDDPVADPYSLENQLKALASSGLGDKISHELFYHTGSEVVKFQEDAMVSVNPKFNPGIFAIGITYVQLSHLLKEWNWVPAKMADYSDPAKHVLDKYDWDGNGRLDPREFIFYSIKENKQMLTDKIIRKFFYTDFVENILDPFFAYADCDGDGVIDAENIWFASELLTCRNPVKWDIYKCDAKAGDSNSDYRTSAVNDLVLKNERTVDGFLNREEFYSGILLGFWDRQVSPRGVLEGDEFNGKLGRDRKSVV